MTTITADVSAPPAGASPHDYRYGWYTTAVLMLAYTFSFLDRQILNLMVGPIKADLGISDTQFALLTGGAFGVFYTIMALPIGWMADRYPRKWIVSGGIALWSLMTAACGFARTFPALLVTRMGVGVGEATLSPSAYSMLSDLFDKTRLPRAMSLYSVGIYIGAGIAMMVGGSVVAAIGRTPMVTLPFAGAMSSWHVVFLVVGLPGLVVALWMTTLREPVRGRSRVSHNEGFSARRIWAFLSAYPLMSVSLFLGSAIVSSLSYMDAWFPELFIRGFHWDVARTGHVNGLTSLTAGPLGMLAAGWLASRMLAGGHVDACLRLAAIAAAAVTLPGILMPLMPNGTWMALLILPLKFLGGFTPVLVPSALQMVAPPAIRAQLGALFMVTVGLVGVSLGPLLPALINDHVFHDETKLHLSVSLSMGIIAPLASFLLFIGLRQYRARIAQIAAEEAAS